MSDLFSHADESDFPPAPLGIPTGPGYPETLSRWRAGKGGWWRYEVFCDGEKVERAIEADVDKGRVLQTALVPRRGLDGTPHPGQVVDVLRDDVQVRRGRVEIRLRAHFRLRPALDLEELT
jgi:hypothetical protein